jgi:hypothetical protein
LYFIEPGIVKFYDFSWLQEPNILMLWKGYSEYP